MRLFRYLEKAHIEDFFDTGALMLSSIHRCRIIEGARQDEREGRSNFFISRGTGGIAGIFDAGANTRLFCTSRVLSDELMGRFGVADYFVVRRPLYFASAISECLEDVVAVHLGDCLYSDNGFETASQAPLLEPPPDFGTFGEERATEWFEAFRKNLSSSMHSSLGNRGLFTKRQRYAHEQEYRFAWTQKDAVDDLKLVSCKDAIRYCSRR